MSYGLAALSVAGTVSGEMRLFGPRIGPVTDTLFQSIRLTGREAISTSYDVLTSTTTSPVSWKLPTAAYEPRPAVPYTYLRSTEARGHSLSVSNDALDTSCCETTKPEEVVWHGVEDDRLTAGRRG